MNIIRRGFSLIKSAFWREPGFSWGRLTILSALVVAGLIGLTFMSLPQFAQDAGFYLASAALGTSIVSLLVWICKVVSGSKSVKASLAKGGGPQASQATGSIEDVYQELVKAIGKEKGVDLAKELGDMILERAVRERASDVHIESQGRDIRVRFRVDGILRDMLNSPGNADIPLLQYIRMLAGFDPEPPVSFRSEEGCFQKTIAGSAIDVRVSPSPTVNGEKLVLKVLDRGQQAIDLEQLGMDQDLVAAIKKIIRSPDGIFFITGPTGSGKTTSLYAMLRDISTPELNICALEDPVECRLEGVNQAQISVKHGFTWAESLRTTLRQDPDVIAIGEIRDFDVAEIGVRAALTGRLVLTTVNAVNAHGTLDRLADMAVPPFLVAPAMLGAMSQRLVRKVCLQCAQKAAAPSEAAIDGLIKSMDTEEGALVRDLILKPGGGYKAGKGCAACRSTGYLGRTGIFELMLMDAEARNQVLEKTPAGVIRRTAVRTGKLRPLVMDGVLKARAGMTTFDEVIRVVLCIA